MSQVSPSHTNSGVLSLDVVPNVDPGVCATEPRFSDCQRALNAALGAVNLLSEHDLSQGQAELVEWIRAGIASGLSRIAAAEDRAAKGSVHPALELSPLDPEALFEPILRAASASASERDIEISLEWDAAMPPALLGDPRGWQRRLETALAQALDACPGELRVRIGFRSDASTGDRVEIRFGWNGQEQAQLTFHAERLPERRRKPALEPWLAGKDCRLLGLEEAEANLLESTLVQLGARVQRLPMGAQYSHLFGGQATSPETVDVICLPEQLVSTFLGDCVMPGETSGLHLVVVAQSPTKPGLGGQSPVLLRLARPLLPRSTEHQLAESAPNHGAPSALKRQTQQLRVLVAESDPISAKVLTRLLESEGHRVDCWNNGLAVLEAVEAQSYDVLFTSVELPQLDGISTCHVLRSREASRGGRLPIVGLVGSDAAEDQQRCLEAGMDTVLPLPLLRERVYWSLSRALALARPSAIAG